MRRALLSIGLILTAWLAACSPAQPVHRLQVITHPDGPLFVGDQVSFEVIDPQPGGTVSLTFQGRQFGSANVEPFGMGLRSQATFWWAWDTHDLQPGRYSLTFTRLPDDYSWTETYALRPQDQVPSPEPGARWASTTSACCILHYLTGTAAERDIQVLSQQADRESAAVAAQFGTKLDEPISVTFMSRVVGQGGFSSNGIYLSYLDGNYGANNMPILFHHEFVHYYDAILGGVYRPPMLTEGLAVYMTGGHYRLEPLAARGAALLDLGWYIPLQTLADDFYSHQHEIGYLEAATLVKYLVATYGWQAFNDFYRSIPVPQAGQTDADVIDVNLRAHFGLSFADLEAAYLASLRNQPFTDAQRSDLRLTVEYFNVARRYQAALDPSAYFMTAWLPDGSVMRQRDIVADFLRHPDAWDNRLSESLLNRADAELSAGDYTAADHSLNWLNELLDVLSP